MMESLSKTTNQQIDDATMALLNPVEQRIAMATVVSASNPKLKDFNSAQAAKAADSIMLKASVMLGQRKKVGEEYELISKALIDSFVKFPNLTVKEIYSATDNGLEGLYRKKEDEPIIFNPSNWIQWVRAYIDETKKPVMKKTSQVYRKEEQESPTPPERDSLVSRYKLLVSALVGSFESGIPYQDYGGILYDLLIKIELINPLNPSGPEMEAAAKWILNNARDQNDKTKINHASDLLQKVMAGASDDSVFSVASRKHVSERIKSVCAEGEDNVIEFLEIAKEKLRFYMQERCI